MWHLRLAEGVISTVVRGAGFGVRHAVFSLFCEKLQGLYNRRSLSDVPARRFYCQIDGVVHNYQAKMSASLLQVFEGYQKARVQFVQAVAEAATRPQNVDVMQNAGVMQLLRPLLLDNVSSICSPICSRPLCAFGCIDRCTNATLSSLNAGS